MKLKENLVVQSDDDSLSVVSKQQLQRSLVCVCNHVRCHFPCFKVTHRQSNYPKHRLGQFEFGLIDFLLSLVRRTFARRALTLYISFLHHDQAKMT